MSVDSTMNWVIPTILILLVIAFLWIKTPLGAWLGPHFSNWWASLKGEAQHHQTKKDKIIVYD